jgi:hypothetical protein
MIITSFFYIKEKKKKNAFTAFLLLSVRANRNDTYLSSSLSLARSLALILNVYFALLFMKSQRKANIEKRAQPVKRRVNKARDNEGELKHIHSHRFLFVFFLLRLSLPLSLSLNYLWTINNLSDSSIVINLSMMID